LVENITTQILPRWSEKLAGGDAPGIAPSWRAMFAVLEQLPVLQDALIGGTLGTLVGNTVAVRRARRHKGAKGDLIVLRWTWVGTGFALALHVVVGLVFDA
jgi:hypothetical protein